MASMTQEQKAKIAAELKKIMPKGWKYSLAVRDHAAIVLTIASAPIDLMQIIRDNREHGKRDDYAELNVYYLSTEFKGNAQMCELFEKIYQTLKGPDYYNNSDTQRDIHDVSHYVRMYLGNWKKAFIVTGADGAPLVAKND